MSYREPNVEHMDEVEMLLQSLLNTGDSIGGSTKFALHGIVTEYKRLKRIKSKQRERTEQKRQREFRLHLQKTGEKHPDDDIPF